MAESGDGEPDEDTKENRKKKLHVVVIILFAILIAGAYFSPVLEFNGSRIRTFSYGELLAFITGRPDMKLPKGVFDAIVLGDNLLETEYGEIRLGNFARIRVNDNGVSGVYEINFKQGKASHNLVIGGIEVPQNVSIFMSNSGHSMRLELNDQDTVVSGITLVVTELYTNVPVYDADISIVFLSSEYVTLEDGTQIHFVLSPFTGRWFWRELAIYVDDKRWEIEDQIAVKLPGETEFTMYRSITFEPDWGAFISGELLEK